MQNPEKSTKRLVRMLGLASAGLGVPMLWRTDDVAHLAGVDDSDLASGVIWAVGAREMAHAGLLLLGPAGAVWTRVLGDALDLGLLAQARQTRRGERRARTTTATAVVLGITARELSAAVRTARRQHGNGRPGPLELHASTTVNRAPHEVYAYWRDFENLPSFMLHLKKVSTDGDERSHWEANTPFLRKVAWDAELTGDEPGRRISWKSLPGSVVHNSGTVHFEAAPGDRGTEVRVVMAYDMPGGRIGRAVAKLTGGEPQQAVRDDLRRFKQVMETGEVVRTDALPQGTDARHQFLQSAAQPPKSRKGSSHR